MTLSAAGIILVVLRFVAVSAAIYLFVALALVFSQSPSGSLSGDTLDFSALTGPRQSDADEHPGPAPLETYQARDGENLGVRRYTSPQPGAPLLIFIHGSGWHGGAYDGLARRLAASGKVDVLLPDLRGHGPDTVTRGDIAYIGQFEDDIADLIKIERQPGQKLVIGGHSSGGGLAVRYAGGAYGGTLDGAVLMAPYLRHDAPSTRSGSGGWAQPMTRRIIGLSMLNSVGITALNGLPAIQFRFPPEVLEGPEGATATASYSYRLNTAYAPRRDYLADVASLPPFLLIAGTEDEAYVATAYEPLMDTVNSSGRYALIEGQSHLGIIDSEQTAGQILDFLATGLN